MKWLKKITVFHILLVSFVIQIALSVIGLTFPQNGDLLRYEDWNKITFIHGASKTYDPNYINFGESPNNQPPGMLYVFAPFYQSSLISTKVIMKALNISEGQNILINDGIINHFFLKLPSIIANLLIGFLIYKIVRSKASQSKAVMASSFYVFNPAVIYNSAIWGQNDSFYMMLLLGSIFFLLTKKYFLSVLILSLSFFYKLSVFPFLPIVGYLFLHTNKHLKILAYGAICLSLVLIFTLPVASNPVSWLSNLFINNLKGENNFITVSAFNFWWAIFKPDSFKSLPSPDMLFIVKLEYWAYILFTLICLPMVYFFLKLRNKVLSPDYLFLLLSIFSLAIFLFLPRMHERYLFPFMVFFPVFLGITNRGKAIYVALTTLYLLNLTSDWLFFTQDDLLLILKNFDFKWVISLLFLAAGGLFFFQSYNWLRKAVRKDSGEFVSQKKDQDKDN